MHVCALTVSMSVSVYATSSGLARFGRMFQNARGPVPWGVTTTKPAAGPFSSSWLYTACWPALDVNPWKFRMSGSAPPRRGSTVGVTIRYSRGAPSKSTVFVSRPGDTTHAPVRPPAPAGTARGGVARSASVPTSTLAATLRTGGGLT
jgi:hypothetical protein